LDFVESGHNKEEAATLDFTIQCLKLGFKKDLGIKINEICVVRA
jgi:hypothetical protein